MLQRILQPPSHEAYELELRTEFLRDALFVATLGTAVYLGLGLLGLYASRLFPWDGILGLLLCILCAGLFWRGTPATTLISAGTLTAGLNGLAMIYSYAYGIRNPVTAVYLPGIILAGTLFGGWVLRLWTLLGMLFVLLWGILELNGLNDSVSFPIQTPLQLWQAVAFWWLLIAATGWLVDRLGRGLRQTAQAGHARAGTLARSLRKLGSKPALNGYLNELLATAVTQLQARWATLLFYDSEHNELMVYAAHGYDRLSTASTTPRDKLRSTAADDVPLWQELVRTKRPIVIEDIAAATHLHYREHLMAQGIQSLLLVPMLFEDKVLGYFNISSLRRRHYQAEELEWVQALATEGALAMQLAAVAQQGREAAIAEERNRLAREIHDTLAQGITGIVMQLEAAEDTLPIDMQATHKHLVRARELARQSQLEARRSVWSLRPIALEEHDLPGALRLMAEQLAPGTAVTPDIMIFGTPYEFPPEVETELLRIGQEALTNALKHARATAVTIKLSYQRRELQLLVRDNGRGFDQRTVKQGFGLISMRERAESIGAQLRVRTSRNVGTEVVCTVPRQSSPAEA